MITDQMNFTTDNVVEVHHETSIIQKITLHRTDTVLHHEIKIIMTETLLLKIIHVLDMITIDDILDPIAHLIEHTDHLRDAILVQNIDHVLFLETTILQNILLHIDLIQDQEIFIF